MTSDRLEQEIERLGPRLGADAAKRVDPERAASAVLARLRSARAERPWWRAVWVPLAAAASLLLVVGWGVRAVLVREPIAIAEEVPLAVSLDQLAESELMEVLDSLEYEAPVAELVSAGLSDLSDAELVTLLASMEG